MISTLLRLWWRAALAVFFRRIDASGMANVPASGPVLLVPNHLNALVDPLVLQTRVSRPVTLTAKSTLAKNPLVAVLMRASNVVALHRSQDRSEGADPAKNAGAFEEIHRRLTSGAVVCLFPEGVSHSDPQVRPFRTGAARIALEFLETSPDLAIVPVGLHYDAKDTWRSRVWIRFGDAFSAAEWRKAHGADVEALTAGIEARVRALTLNFERRGESTLLSWAADMLLTGAAPPPMLGREDVEGATLAARVALVERLQAAWAAIPKTAATDALAARVRAWRSEIIRLGLTPEEVFLPMHAGRAAFFVLRELELAIVGLPIAAWGTLMHAGPYYSLRAIARALSKDRDHWASNTVLPSVAVIPFFYALQIGGAFLLLDRGWAALYALTLPYAGWYAVLWRDRAGNVVRRARTFLLFLLDRGRQRRLAEEASSILREIRALEA